MTPHATLVSFATGEIFERYADAMFASAEHLFFSGRAQHLRLQTTPEFPYSVRDRHTYILKARRQIRGRFVFFVDADVLFEGRVEEEIVADGITAVLHPVQNDQPPAEMTYERNPASAAYVPEDEGSRYYLGGIVGGTRDAFLDLSRQIDAMCQHDGAYCPVWQDESYLNRILIDQPPALELDERYCAWWSHQHVTDVRIRALNKTDEEVLWRDRQIPAHIERTPTGAFMRKEAVLQ